MVKTDPECRSVMPGTSHDKLLLQIIFLQVKTDLRKLTPKYPLQDRPTKLSIGSRQT